jgi:coproporphyrinogen III oxidase
MTPIALDASPTLAPPTAMRERAEAWTAALQDDLTALFERLDGGDVRFREDAWRRPGGGGGRSRVLVDGRVFEKAGVNQSVVEGLLPAEARRRLGGRGADEGAARFFATGVSVVVHPRSPMVPTMHLNVRYFELADLDGRPLDAWFGGGSDLTPTYPHEADARHFHAALRATCDAHHASLYTRFKPWCDEYFVNAHRDGERRGVGGVFFDHLRATDDASGLEMEALFAFAREVGTSPHSAYAPIVERRRDEPWGEPERALQLHRRARYAEFNLVHDRGTLFGLQTNARVESVLMSMPPLAAWGYAPTWEPGSIGARLHAMLEPRDWA